MKHCEQDSCQNLKNFAGNASPRQLQQPRLYINGTKSGSIPAIIQNFSSITTRKINQIRSTPGVKLWQRGYYDRIIRNSNELFAIRKYITNNPLNWKW